MPPRLSIVVPVYNVELYLDECLESIASQTFADFEVILDGHGEGPAPRSAARRLGRFHRSRRPLDLPVGR
ncbi:glycosyltransferase [Streptomyces avidinii]